MNRYWIYILCFCFHCFSGCSGKKEIRTTIPEEKLVKFLMDAHILESALQDGNSRNRDSFKVIYYKQLYEIHGITEVQFLENIEILDKQPAVLSRVYSKVMEEVSKLEADEKDKKKKTASDTIQ